MKLYAIVLSALGLVLFCGLPTVSHADRYPLNLQTILICARHAGIVKPNESNRCFRLARESDGSFGLIEVCGQGGAMSTRAFFYQVSERNGYAVAPDFTWNPCW